VRHARAAVLLLLALLATACATHPAANATAEVEAAFQRYGALMLAMDHSAIAAMFSADGEIVNAGQAPIRGPAMINAFLAGFSDYQVLAYSTEPPATRVSGDHASLQSIYHERVRTPDGRLLRGVRAPGALWRRSTHRALVRHADGDHAPVRGSNPRRARPARTAPPTLAGSIGQGVGQSQSNRASTRAAGVLGSASRQARQRAHGQKLATTVRVLRGLAPRETRGHRRALRYRPAAARLPLRSEALHARFTRPR
jgi:ketosteroid isomerase-like protein